MYLIFHNVNYVCLSDCRKGSFLCKTGVCVHQDALSDGQMDCLDGEDESVKHTMDNSEIHRNQRDIFKSDDPKIHSIIYFHSILEITETFAF